MLHLACAASWTHSSHHCFPCLCTTSQLRRPLARGRRCATLLGPTLGRHLTMVRHFSGISPAAASQHGSSFVKQHAFTMSLMSHALLANWKMVCGICSTCKGRRALKLMLVTFHCMCDEALHVTRLHHCKGTLQYDYEDDYDKVDTEPFGTLIEAFYAATDILSLQQVCASPLCRVLACSAACLQHPGLLL